MADHGLLLKYRFDVITRRGRAERLLGLTFRYMQWSDVGTVCISQTGSLQAWEQWWTLDCLNNRADLDIWHLFEAVSNGNGDSHSKR